MQTHNIMKKTFIILSLLFGFLDTYAQNSCQPPIYYFNNKSNVSGSGGLNSVYRFNSVLSGIDAVVTVTRIQNASMNNNNMDNATGYSVAWQPFVTFPSSRSNASDSSYIEYKIQFVATGTNNLVNQNCMGMGVVDLDGTGSQNGYRELIKVSLPGTPMGVSNSTISVSTDSKWVIMRSGSSQFNNIDTVNAAAMGQINFPNGVNTFYMRVGVLGPVSSNTQRQYSFYFKSFAALNVPLPVYLSDFRSKVENNTNQLKWVSTYESNFSHFEIYRSNNGSVFEPIGIVEGKGGMNTVNEYQFNDVNNQELSSGLVFYKLKMLDLDGKACWSYTIANNPQQVDIIPSNIYIYPNPASNFVYVQSEEGAEIQTVTLLDIYGKQISSLENDYSGNALAFDLNQLATGMYTLLVYSSDGSIVTKQFVKK